MNEQIQAQRNFFFVLVVCFVVEEREVVRVVHVIEGREDGESDAQRSACMGRSLRLKATTGLGILLLQLHGYRDASTYSHTLMTLYLC